MTKKEHLIELLFAHCPGNVDKKCVEVCFDIINKYDWAVFCSQMGDYDHPGERKQAKEDMEKQLYEFTHPFGTESFVMKEVVEHVQRNLEGDIYEASKFYNNNFHHMSEEYKEE